MSSKTILCAIDFSESSIQAVKVALTVAKWMKAKVVIMYCYRLISEKDNDEVTLNLKKNIENEASRKFSELEAKLKSVPDVPYQFITEVGFFSFRIEMFIRKSSTSMLVTGDTVVQNFNDYKNLSFEQFVKTARIPVMIVPNGVKDL